MKIKICFVFLFVVSYAASLSMKPTSVIGKLDVCGYGKLWHITYLHKQQNKANTANTAITAKVPLLVLHGGPGVPSDYLFPLAAIDRDVIFYDQLGCGRSDAPPFEQHQSKYYSVEHSVAMLQAIIKHFQLKHYHIYGQSWGGLLAFSHLNSISMLGKKDEVLSLTLSNCPTSVRLVEQEAAKLIEKCGGVEGFMKQHNCRLPVQPIELIDA